MGFNPVELRKFRRITRILPGYHLIQQEFLLPAGTCEVDAGRFDALMSEKICQQRDIAASGQEIFCEAVAEGLGVHGIGIDAVPDCIMF